MVPTHIEQACNAYDAALSGAGIVVDCFDLDRLSELSKNHSGNMSFRHWVKQADWLILREFRPDLLFHELPGRPIGTFPADLMGNSQVLLANSQVFFYLCDLK